MPKLLLVDDNELNGDLLMRRLEMRGYQVSVALDGLSGVARALSEKPDLIIMDLSMPGIDGWQATRRLKNEPATAWIPIIALSGHVMPNERDTALAAGCDDYETKPVRFAVLLDKIEALLARGKKPAASSPEAVSAAASGTRPMWPLPPGVDEEMLKRLRHDLRTPLNQIIGYTEMLIESSGDHGFTRLSDDLKPVLDAGNQILARLNEGLVQWKVEAGKVDLIALRRDLLGPLAALMAHRDRCEASARTLNLNETTLDLEKVGLAATELRRMLEPESFAERYHLGAPVPSTGSSAPITPGIAPQAVSPLRGHILVVDDEALNCEMLVRRLERMGFTASVATNGRHALEMINVKTFDLVLLDILMPVLDGFQTLERLKADEQHRHIPVIMVTALDEVSATVRCIEAGAEDYVPKPFNAVILRARIGASLEKKRLRDQERAHLQEIQAERAKSERLLLNVLPKAIAERLKSGDTSVVDAVADATVLIADIVNFTRIAAELAPTRTVALLNELFSEFDRLVEQVGIEKIKTIGDAYMAVGGVPVAIPDHAARCARMALAMLDSVAEFNVRTKQTWQLRIGIHTGPLVAGIIGSKKFAYDLWGDTVNIASRLESHGEVGMAQVSQATADLLANEFVLEKRGAVELKNRGEMMVHRLVGRKRPG
jgi:adenylate cyclase